MLSSVVSSMLVPTRVCPPIKWSSWSGEAHSQEGSSIHWAHSQLEFLPEGQTIHRVFVATAPNNMDIACNAPRSAWCNLCGMYGHMSQVEMPPLDPTDQSITGTTVQFPSTWPLSPGIQIVSPLKLDGKKEFLYGKQPSSISNSHLTSLVDPSIF
jgi:hypothetical protein